MDSIEFPENISGVSKNMHDAYFKEVFSNIENTTDLLQSALPELSKNIDFESLELQSTSYIDKDLKSEFSDLVYNCNFENEKIEVTLIFEHKSSPDIYVELQLLSYIQSTWNLNLKQNKKVLPVISIIFHHGSKKLNLTIFDRLKQLPESIRKYQPLFMVETIDTATLTSEDIMSIFKTAKLKFVMVVMKHIQSSPEKVLDELKRFGNIVIALKDTPNGKNLIQTTAIYIGKKPGTKMETIIEKFAEIEKEVGQIAKSAWEIEFEKGIEKGIEKNVIKMLEFGIEISMIENITGLSIKRINELQKQFKI